MNKADTPNHSEAPVGFTAADMEQLHDRVHDLYKGVKRANQPGYHRVQRPMKTGKRIGQMRWEWVHESKLEPHERERLGMKQLSAAEEWSATMAEARPKRAAAQPPAPEVPKLDAETVRWFTAGYGNHAGLADIDRWPGPVRRVALNERLITSVRDRWRLNQRGVAALRAAGVDLDAPGFKIAVRRAAVDIDVPTSDTSPLDDSDRMRMRAQLASMKRGE